MDYKRKLSASVGNGSKETGKGSKKTVILGHKAEILEVQSTPSIQLIQQKKT